MFNTWTFGGKPRSKQHQSAMKINVIANWVTKCVLESPSTAAWVWSQNGQMVSSVDLRQSKASSRWPHCVTAHHPQFTMAVVKLFLKHMQHNPLQKPAKGGRCFCIVLVEKYKVFKANV